MKVDFILTEDIEILKWVLELDIPFEVETPENYKNHKIYSFYTSAKVEELSVFTFTTISNNGMVNSDFDLNYLDEIVKWRNGKKTSEAFNLWL